MVLGNNTQRRAYLWCLVALFGVLMSMAVPARAQRSDASEHLQKAIDYFQSEKYHEAALLFGSLNRKYSLNPRYMAYYALCLYKEKEYAMCVEIFDSVMPQLEPYSPQERSVYAFAAAESHFALRQYLEASSYYDCHLSLCHVDERADTLYRLGLCAMFQANYDVAYERFLSALAYYFKEKSSENLRARIRQTEHLAAGCRDRIAAKAQ